MIGYAWKPGFDYEQMQIPPKWDFLAWQNGDTPAFLSILKPVWDIRARPWIQTKELLTPPPFVDPRPTERAYQQLLRLCRISVDLDCPG
jgi:hypothetical protein